ncbi:MAG: SAM-dependent methyltransferase [Pseudonocardiales bacterium]|nr:MAG: SAM-dependent methyltransferase [Pseudonocardiales bacterium]
MPAFDQYKAQQALAWGSAPFARLAEQSADTHNDLLAELGVRPGERMLDVATGTGALALRAAHLGAIVTAQDLAPQLVDVARYEAAARGYNDIRIEIGDCEQLPYDDASFDIVCSAQGCIFAPDHYTVSRELARVCKIGGRIGLTAWRPAGAIERFFRIIAQFQPPLPQGAGNFLDWGRRDYVTNLLGNAFILEFSDKAAVQSAAAPQEMWELMSTTFGPVNYLLESLDVRRKAELCEVVTDLYARYYTNGKVSFPREYTVIMGYRRTDQ